MSKGIRMNSSIRNLMMIAGATLGGVGAGAGIVFAQATSTPETMGAATQPAVSMPMANRGPAIPGTLSVTRLSDTSFVVVKDTGDSQIVTLFTTETGLVKKQHTGKFLY